MTSAEEHHRWREQLGAYVLDALDPHEAVAVLAHLDACATCRREEEELRRTAAVLAAADLDGVSDAHPPPWLGERVVDAVAAARRAEQARRRRGAALLGAAAAVIAVVALGVGLLLGGAGDGDDGDGEELAVPVSFTVAPARVEAAATVEERPWGTTVHLEASGLTPGRLHQAWLELPDGERVSAGTFRPDEQRAIRCYLSAAVTPSEAVAFGVSIDGETLLLADLG